MHVNKTYIVKYKHKYRIPTIINRNYRAYVIMNINRVYNKKYKTQRRGKNLQLVMGPLTMEVLQKNLK